MATQSLLEMARIPRPDVAHQVVDKLSQQSTELTSTEQEQTMLRNEGKTKKPLSFHMTFLALNICVLLVSLDATALSVAVPVSATNTAFLFATV